MEQIDLNFRGQKIRLFLRNEADRSVMREIFKLREYGVAEEVITAATYPIVDAGAHVGFFALYCRVLNKKAQIFAVEPVKDNLDLLFKHVKENKISGVKIADGALARESGKRLILTTEDGHDNRLLGAGEKDKNARKVEALSYGDFCKKWKIEKVSLLKLDVEGAEGEILRGLTKDDWARTRAVILEYHEKTGGAKKEMEGILRENGFGVRIFPSKFDKNLGFIFANNKR